MDKGRGIRAEFGTCTYLYGPMCVCRSQSTFMHKFFQRLIEGSMEHYHMVTSPTCVLCRDIEPKPQSTPRAVRTMSSFFNEPTLLSNSTPHPPVYIYTDEERGETRKIK